MNKQPVAIQQWVQCVKDAKANLLLPADTFVPIEGQLLKEAQKLYCSSPSAGY